MMAVTGIIVIVLVVILAVVGGSGAAKSATVVDAVAGKYADQKIQVTGNVVENSYATNDNVLTFAIYDKDGNPAEQLNVRYEGGVSATFGNDVTAICTGKIAGDGVLHATELVTKCPSKYESATDALSVTSLLDYGDSIINTTVKLKGTVKAGTLTSAAESGEPRFVVVDASDASREIAVDYDGALADGIADGTSVVVTGSLEASGAFKATDVAQEG